MPNLIDTKLTVIEGNLNGGTSPRGDHGVAVGDEITFVRHMESNLVLCSQIDGSWGGNAALWARTFIGRFDPEADHIVATVMLGIEPHSHELIILKSGGLLDGNVVELAEFRFLRHFDSHQHGEYSALYHYGVWHAGG